MDTCREWFVSLDGNDENNGSSSRPFRTITKAYASADAAYRSGLLEERGRITVRPGVYFLTAPLTFAGEAPVTIVGEPGAVISGGYAIPAWEKVKLNGKTVLRAELPRYVPPVRMLLAENQTSEPARFPKEGYYRTAKRACDEGKFVTEAENFDSFLAEKKDVDDTWFDPGNIYVRMIHRWIEETLLVESLDGKSGLVRTASRLRYAPDHAITEYCFCNVREALTRPGEFYYDRNEHAVYYLPLKRTNAPVAEVPVCGELVRMMPGCRNLALEGLTFRCAGSYFPENGPELDLRSGYGRVKNECGLPHSVKFSNMPELQSGQSAVHVPGIILAEKACDCTIRHCTVEQCAWYGIQLSMGCRRFRILGCEFRELGAGGLRIGGSGDVEDFSNITSAVIAEDNHIHDCGKVFHAACGILLTHARNCLLAHNHIHDLYYTGISCGWNWGFAPNVSCENRIIGNHIHDLGKGLLSDMGGVYTLGIQPGTRVAENRIHHITSRYYGGWGLYTDEGSSHIVLERNLVYDCFCEGYHQHYGRENIVRENIFVCGGDAGAAFSVDPANKKYASPGENHTRGMNFFNNLIVQDGKPCIRLTEFFPPERLISDGNFYCDLSGKKPVFLHKDRICTFAQWQKLGLDRLSEVVSDPGFTDICKRDFRLKPHSILRKLGFAIPEAGCREKVTGAPPTP